MGNHIVWIGNTHFEPDKNAIDFGKTYFCQIDKFQSALESGNRVKLEPMITDPDIFSKLVNLICEVEEMIAIVKSNDANTLSPDSIVVMRQMLNRVKKIEGSL